MKAENKKYVIIFTVCMGLALIGIWLPMTVSNNYLTGEVIKRRVWDFMLMGEGVGKAFMVNYIIQAVSLILLWLVKNKRIAILSLISSVFLILCGLFLFLMVGFVGARSGDIESAGADIHFKIGAFLPAIIGVVELIVSIIYLKKGKNS